MLEEVKDNRGTNRVTATLAAFALTHQMPRGRTYLPGLRHGAFHSKGTVFLPTGAPDGGGEGSDIHWLRYEGRQQCRTVGVMLHSE